MFGTATVLANEEVGEMMSPEPVQDLGERESAIG